MPYAIGTCQCGCGAAVPLAKKSDPKRGLVRGEPVRFLRGHHNKVGAMPAEERKARALARLEAWSAANPERVKAYRAEWEANNPERTRAKYRRYWSNHADRLGPANRQRTAEWNAKYRDRENAKKRERFKVIGASFNRLRREQRLENPESVRERDRARYAANPLPKRLRRQKRHALIKGTGADLSPTLIPKLLARQKGRCITCPAKFSKTGYDIDHIVPLAKGGRHEDANIQLLCPSCNRSKGAKDPVEFMQSRGFLL